MTLAQPTHLKWHVRELWAALDPLLPGVSVEVMAQVESTNSALVDRARLSLGPRSGAVGASRPQVAAPTRERSHGRRSMDAQPCLLVAEQQTRGRGRLGRSWLSSAGASLTFSLALPLAPVDWSGLSLALGVAVAEALDPPRPGSPLRIVLKWPNDLWLRDVGAPYGARKLGGILIETVPIGGRRMCVVGVGLNIRPQALTSLSSGYASLSELDASTSAPEALLRVAAPLARALREFERGGFGGFRGRFAARDALAGRRVSTTQDSCPDAIAEGVDDRGALCLLCRDGRRLVVNSGDVTVRPLSAGGPGA